MVVNLHQFCHFILAAVSSSQKRLAVGFSVTLCKRPKNPSNHLNFHNPCSSVRFLLAAV